MRDLTGRRWTKRDKDEGLGKILDIVKADRCLCWRPFGDVNPADGRGSVACEDETWGTMARGVDGHGCVGDGAVRRDTVWLL